MTHSFFVAPTRYLQGASHESDVVPALVRADFDRAFRAPWGTDACLVTYCLDNPNGSELPRLKKEALSSIRGKGHDLLRHCVAIDCDTPGHLPWGESLTVDAWMERFRQACESFPPAGDYACLYTTPRGVRIVYILREMIPVDRSEAPLAAFLDLLRHYGIDCDPAGVAWTSLFRLPQAALEDGRNSSDLPSFRIEHRPDARLDLMAAASFHLPPSPPPGLVEVSPSWEKEARRRLRGCRCYDTIYEGVPLASAGSRNSTIFQYVGEAISALFKATGTTPERIHALFRDSVNRLETQPGEDWEEVLWDAVRRLWQKESYARGPEKALDLRKRILDGMREWCSAPELKASDEDAALWIERRYIATSGQSHYIMGPDGRYRNQPYSLSQLPAALRVHLQGLVQTEAKGGDSPLQSIINRHSTIVEEVIARADGAGGEILRMDQPGAALVLVPFRRNPALIPEYSNDVNEWLVHLFGESGFEDGCRWIAWALAWEDGPICALSIAGNPGAGKKMLIRGLMETLETPSIATEQDISGEYQYGLLRSPFLLVNEGWSGTTRGKSPADKFRELVSGDSFFVNRKYRDPVKYECPIRVILSANNLSVIRALCGKGDLNQADREALAIRLLHFTVGDAADWLRDKGGMEWTGSEGRRWIASDSGRESDFIIAKHFLWLHANRESLWSKGSRFLVEGHGSSELMYQMQTQVGPVVLVIEAILKMLNRKVPPPGLEIREDRIFVTIAGILDFFREYMSRKMSGEGLTASQIARALEGICEDDDILRSDTPAIKRPKGGRKWRVLDTRRLLRAANEFGFQCDVLQRMVFDEE